MAAKIKDGLFIGDAETSQSEVFINDNKISNLINLAGREVHNVWASHGLVYLTYYWEDRPDYKLFSSHEDALLTDIVEFIDVSISHGISVLLFSRNGTGRCVVAACLYLMMKYRWGFEKTYDYVYSKKPDIDLNKGFIQQMFALDMKLLAARQKAQAVKYGVDNGFKIEANMTISDISAMLPPVEAKRWNGWDPAYVIETAELAAQQSDGESKGEGGRYKDNKADHKRSSDPHRSNSSSSLVRTSHGGTIIHGPGTGEDDELILIYSFLNSKNTITVLPGPYLDVYDIPKNFKLKFNPVCYEEDVNWFPSAKTKAERVVLKGSRARLAAQTAAVYAQPKSPGPSTAAPGGGGGGGGHSRAEAAADSKRFSDAKALEPVPNNNNNTSSSNANSNGAYSAGAKSVVALENIAPMHVIRSQREAAAAELNNHNHSNNNSSSNSTGQYGNSGSGNHNHHNGSMQDDSGAGAQMYYAHPSMSNAAATPLSSSSNAAGGQTGEGYFNPDHSPPTSAYSSPVHANTHKEAPRNVNSGGGSGSGQSPNLSNDLYEFVGISTDQGTRGKTSREAPQRTWGPRDSIAVHKDHSSSSLQSAVSQQQQQQHQQPERGYGRGEDYKESEHSRQQQQAQQAAMSSSGSRSSSGGVSAQQPLSAEDRLRNLMADMQRHKAGAASSSHGPGSSNSASEARDIRDSSSRGERGPTGPSLYELATMQIPSNTAGARPHSSSNATGGNARRDAYDQDLEMEGLDQDSEVDPLSAFQRIQDQPYGSNSGTGSRGAGPSGGAVRARHDVITHGTGRPGSAGASGRYPASSSSSGTPAGPRSAWGGSSTGPGPAGGSRGTSPASSRPASPQPGASSGAYSSVPSRYASPSAKRTTGPGGSASVSSNLSVNSINSAGSNQVVGAGASSGSRVYRHGSPAPNVSRTNTAGLAPRSSASGPSVGRQHILASSGQQGSGRALQPNSSIANSSVSSLGSGIVGAGTGNNAGAQRPLSSSGRYASPSAAQQPTRRAPSSNAAAASLYSAEALQQQQQQQGERVRRSVNSSPMRGSGGGLSSSGGAGGTSTGAPRRYASPGPQKQQQQYDFDSLASGGTAGSGSRPGSRSGTPTSRATWRF